MKKTNHSSRDRIFWVKFWLIISQNAINCLILTRGKSKESGIKYVNWDARKLSGLFGNPNSENTTMLNSWENQLDCPVY
jgi:hypothetical protein